MLFAVFALAPVLRIPLNDRDAQGQHPVVIGGSYVSDIDVLAKDQLPVVGPAGA